MSELETIELQPEQRGASMLGTERHFNLYKQYYAMRLPEPRVRSTWLTRVESIAEDIGAMSALDYGCGIARGLSFSQALIVRDYDPGVYGLECPPTPKDLVCCIHVLEHIEPECLGAVLEHIEALARKAVFIVVSTETSTKRLPDGSPWHSLVQSAECWQELLTPKYERQLPMKDGKEYAALWMKCTPSAPTT